jgi:type II secretory ATPase GspE/PulE/Tfp pilus assembly ATPase PilB-like protein
MGRVAIAEFLEIDEEISTRIRSKEIPLTIDEYLKENSIKTIKDDALIKVLQGITSIEEVQYII